MCVPYVERHIRAFVHGDNFTTLGSRKQLDGFKGRIESKSKIKYKGRLGTRDTDIKSVRILNRIVTLTSEGIDYESDQRHAKIIVKQTGLKEDSKAVATPVIRVKPGEVPGGEKEIGPQEQTVFRGIVARANYLGQDRSDIRFAVKELSRRMAKPRIRDVAAAERLARYLATRMRMI